MVRVTSRWRIFKVTFASIFQYNMQQQQAPVIGSSAPPDNRHLYLPPDQHRQWIHQQQHQADMNNGNDQELEQYFPTPSPRKPFVPSSYMNVPKKQQQPPASSRGPSRLQQQATSGSTVQPPAVTPMGSIHGGVYGHHQVWPLTQFFSVSFFVKTH